MKNEVTVILPIYNLQKRGLKRVYNSVYSLLKQDCDIIVVDGSTEGQFKDLRNLLRRFDGVLHYHCPLEEFNKPKLLNKGIELSKTKYIFCSDADYIFKYDLISSVLKMANEKTLIHKRVKMLPNANITPGRIDSWRFPECKFNPWGTLANGAMQFAPKQFFVDHPYIEEMSGFGAMDNLTTYVAYNNGFKIIWMEESEILHQHHAIEKKMAGSNLIKFKRNQKILQDYVDSNNLPTLLKKNV